jgi:hypothetical protein
MQVAARNLGSRGHRQAEHNAHQLSARLGSAQAYADGGGYMRSVSTGGTRGYGGASYDASAQADLQSFGVQMSNSVQTSTSNSFAGGQHVFQQIDAVSPGFDLMAPVPSGAAVGLGTVVGAVHVGGPLGGGLAGPMWTGGAVSADPGIVAPVVAAPAPPPSPPLSRTDSKKAKSSKLSKKSKSW